jgi:hypothetical protein
MLIVHRLFGFNLPVLLVNHSGEKFQFVVGQIVGVTKEFTNCDVGAKETIQQIDRTLARIIVVVPPTIVRRLFLMRCRVHLVLLIAFSGQHCAPRIQNADLTAMPPITSCFLRTPLRETRSPGNKKRLYRFHYALRLVRESVHYYSVPQVLSQRAAQARTAVRMPFRVLTLYEIALGKAYDDGLFRHFLLKLFQTETSETQYMEAKHLLTLLLLSILPAPIVPDRSCVYVSKRSGNTFSLTRPHSIGSILVSVYFFALHAISADVACPPERHPPDNVE